MVRRIAIISLALFGLILGAAWMTPDRWRVEWSTDIEAPAEVIWIWLSAESQWPEWMSSPSDELRIVDSEPLRRVRLAGELEGRFSVTGAIELALLDNGRVRVHWREEGKLGWDPLFRLLRPMLEKDRREELTAGLDALQELAEAEAKRRPPTPDPHFRLPTVRLLQDAALPEPTPAQ
jgi:hypothetical protein